MFNHLCNSLDCRFDLTKRSSKQNHVDRWLSSWCPLYFLIPAVVMPLVCIRNDTMSEMASMWREDIKLSIEVIRKIMPICPPALRVLSLIKRVDEFADIEIEVPLQIPDILDESSPISQLMQLHTMLWPGSFDFTSPL